MALSAPYPRLSRDPEAARRAFLRVIEINREESGPFLRLGRLALQSGDFETAFRHFSTASGFGSPEGTFEAGRVRFLQRRFEEASSHFLKVLEKAAIEQAISSRGITSEGDVGGRSQLTALEAAALQAFVFLYWSSPGGYATSVPVHFRFEPPSQELHVIRRKGVPGNSGRGTWIDFDRDKEMELGLVVDRGLLLYDNRGGRWETTGILAAPGAWDATWGDFDGDGGPDVYVYGPGWIGQAGNRLFRSRRGSFADVTRPAGLEGRRSTLRALFLDHDRDGDLDLAEAGLDGLRLYDNQGGSFREKSSEAGLTVKGKIVDMAAADWSGDGRQDLALLRWRSPLVLYRSQGSDRYREVTIDSGLGNVGGDGLSLLFFDYNRDGRPDLLVTRHAPRLAALQSLAGEPPGGRPNRLFETRGRGRFEEVLPAGLEREFGVVQAVSADLDRDGRPDLLLANHGLFSLRLRQPRRVSSR